MGAALMSICMLPMFRTLTALPIGWALFGICATIVYGVYFSAVSQMVLLVVLALTTFALLFANITQGSLSSSQEKIAN